jgi:hypothetical protein
MTELDKEVETFFGGEDKKVAKKYLRNKTDVVISRVHNFVEQNYVVEPVDVVSGTFILYGALTKKNCVDWCKKWGLKVVK